MNVSLVKPEMLGYFSGCIAMKPESFAFSPPDVSHVKPEDFKEDLKELTEEKCQTETELVPDS